MTPGSAIAHYRISEKLGEGGMGAVYRATDTRLQREVAIKVLPPAFSEDPARMARFEREAQVLASLNHPNIAQIYGIEQGGLIMELVEGADLAVPVPLDTALDYARQIAEALEAAHERGIIHRDLKPANIKITPAGQVKLLDFGLAKAADPATSASPAAPTISPTLSLAMTQAGMILGTAAYMAPEQARGKLVDRRADIWAFGVVLYEMLSGRRLFEGDNLTDVIAAVVTREPGWSALPDATPAHVRRLLRRCLERDPRLRLRDIGEARIALSAPPDEPAPPAAPAASRSRIPWIVAAICGVAAIGAGVVALRHFRETPPPVETVRYQLRPPEGAVFSNVSPSNGIALSPDGKQLAFVAAGRSGAVALYVQSLDSLTARPLAATESAGSPFWSPDSRSIGFFVNGQLKRVDLSGAPPVTICEVTGVAIGGSWNRDGVIIFGVNNGPIHRASAGATGCAPLLQIDRARSESFQARPWFLPDGRRFLYLSRTDDPSKSGVYLGSLDGAAPKRLLEAREAPAYVPPADGARHGHILFLRESTLLAQPVDSASLDPRGEPFFVADKVGAAISAAFFTVSGSGVLAYRSGGFTGENQLLWLDRNGKHVGALGPGGLGREFDLSRDGRRVVLSRVLPATALTDLWTVEVDRGVPVRFTFDSAPDRFPVWSPDGKRIVFSSRRGAGVAPDLYVKDASGSGSEQLLFGSPDPKSPWDWSDDGKFLLFSVTASTRAPGIWSLPADGSGQPEPFAVSAYSARHAVFSPGVSGPRWVAYESTESGRFEVYVQSFPPGRGRFQISTDGGSLPRWRRDGKELYYIAADLKLMAVDVKLAPEFQSGAPRPLFTTSMFGHGILATLGHLYAPSPDGQRFLIQSQLQETGETSPVTVVLNWLKPR